MLNQPSGRHVVLDSTEAPIANVIVLAWRLVDELLDAVEGLARSTSDNPFNVTVVLNGAHDSVRRAVFEQVTGANVVDAAVNLGFAGGCNLGAADARGEFLAFLNDDATPEPEWLDNLINCARDRPDAGAIASCIYNPDGTVQEAGARILAGGGIGMGSGTEVLPTELGERRNVDFGGAEALLVRRELFVEVGGFDQTYDPAYFEDVDLCLRLRAAGWNIVYEPSAVVVHHHSTSTREDLEWREFAFERSKAVFFEHWGPLLSNAAKVDDPPDVLMPVPPGYGMRPLDLSEQVAASRDVGALDGKRQREFHDWIRKRLSHATARVEEEESRCKELEMANEQLRSRLQALEDRLGTFEQLQTLAAAQQQELTYLLTAPLRVLLGRRARAWLRSHARVHRMVAVVRARRR